MKKKIEKSGKHNKEETLVSESENSEDVVSRRKPSEQGLPKGLDPSYDRNDPN